ncbi:MAG: hypothetical protein ACD_57C00192G0005 [uncultured bacterium]|uniref:Small ribosomal subunit protein bS6 n=1 Tax=Candidatus Curtissbacteria bacterium RIFOXYA1_FULL_41_14 TaxID=1797737 RepID=A0A1F5HCW4_9BACT|nr:MAG: hypothetical protein ACD_57C00192G0005 [uncultured bacterium]KKR60032.1 MAG: 30S ribosomal protein S6 [Microgenomates group bacterium GW2011_GWC1_40_35]KKR77298.1 MAG: 30S ribosomal protein S6 [Candidatus Curtissbacteria bacterium GW2011_GWD1_40_8]KKS00992.1 MAG: 30S ribosomal protein S6 [Candidatus Curtissbacteria bacterium GW2011_GWC2_41_21]OGD92309.1 MAG: 30S ribosomal protein S6 [Candidatus Curtissbacteria bacterium RIFCSPHIGHO2_12_FULL_41_13]OGE01919.1 MAG: 30S ribosomal protein S
MRYDLMVAVGIKDADSLAGKLEKFIKDAAAQEVKVEKLGKKTLAYPIAKQLEAEYFLFNFEAPAEAISAITQNLRLERETILRYLLTKVTKVTKGTRGTKGTKELIESEGEKTKETGKVVVKTVVKAGTKVTKGTKGTKGTKVKGKKS